MVRKEKTKKFWDIKWKSMYSMGKKEGKRKLESYDAVSLL